MEFKAGDKVIILNKTKGNYLFEAFCARVGYKHNQILTILSIDEISINLIDITFTQIGGSWIFKPSELLKIVEEEKIMYKLVEPVSVNFIWMTEEDKTHCFLQHFRSLITELKPDTLNSQLDEKLFLDWAIEDSSRINWLKKHKFIEEVEEKYYKVGDKFKHNATNDIYLLVFSLIPHMIDVVNLTLGPRVEASFICSNHDKIKKSELTLILQECCTLIAKS